MQKYAKAITALLGALATWGITAAEDETYTQVELWGAVLAVATALGVWAVPNAVKRRRDAGHTDIGSLAVVALIAAAVSVLVVVLWGDDLLR